MAVAEVRNLVFMEPAMNKRDYLNILKNNTAPSVKKLALSRSWIFKYDNDPKHTSKIA